MKLTRAYFFYEGETVQHQHCGLILGLIRGHTRSVPRRNVQISAGSGYIVSEELERGGVFLETFSGIFISKSAPYDSYSIGGAVSTFPGKGYDF